MAIVYSSIALVSLIVSACWLITKCLGDRRLGLQDSILRASGMLVLTAPLFCWIYNSSYKIPVPLLSASLPIDSSSTSQQSAYLPVNISEDHEGASDTSVADEHQTREPANMQFSDHLARLAQETTTEAGPQRLAVWPMISTLGYLGLATWGIGSVVALLQLLRALVKSHAIKAGSCAIDDPVWHNVMARVAASLGIARHKVQLRSSASISSPILVGFRVPTILIPIQLLKEALSSKSCEHIVTHELIHVQRRDMNTNLLLQVALVLWWWHPLVHWLKNKTTVTRELICDASTTHYQNAEDYAETLLQLTIFRANEPKLALSIAGRAGDLERRIAWILTRPSIKHIGSASRKMNRLLFATVSLLFLFGSIVRLTPIAAQEPNKAESSNETRLSSAANEEEPTEENMLKLPPLISGRDFQGRVLMPDGQPAKEADVYLLLLKAAVLPWKPLSAKANSEGAFEFSKLPPGNYMVWAETSDMVSHFNPLFGRRLNIEESPSRVDDARLKLHHGSTFRFKVTDAKTGEPLQGVTIQPYPTGLIRDRVTDKNGQADYRNLTSTNWRFTIHKDGYAYSEKSVFKQPLGSESDLTVQLSKGVTIRGKLVAQQNEPVGNCELFIHRSDMAGPDIPRTTSKSDGTFEFRDIPSDSGSLFEICADIETHERTDTTVNVSEATDSLLECEIFIPRRKLGVSARFHIVDESGNAIVSAKLSNIGNPSGRKRNSTSDANGNAQLENMFAGGIEGADGYRVSVSADGYLDSKMTIPAESTLANSEVKVVLKRGNLFKGRVVSPEGKPVPNVPIYAVDSVFNGQMEREAKTDENGDFILSGFENRLALSTMSPSPYLSLRHREFEIDPNNQDVHIIALQYMGRIRVRAVDEKSGKELPQYNVKVGFSEIRTPDDPKFFGLSPDLTDPGMNIVGGTTEFQFDNEPIGAPYWISVTASGYKTTRLARVVTVKNDAAQITIVPMHKLEDRELMSVTGTLRNSAGPVSNAKVRLFVSNEPRDLVDWMLLERNGFKDNAHCVQFLETTSDERGNFQFKGVLRSARTVEIYYTHASGDQRFPNLELSQSEEHQHFDLIARPMGTLRFHFDTQHYPDAQQVTISLNSRLSPSAKTALAFSSRTFSAHQFSTDKVDELKLPFGEYNIRIEGKAQNENSGKAISRSSLFERKILLTEESPFINLEL